MFGVLCASAPQQLTPSSPRSSARMKMIFGLGLSAASAETESAQSAARRRMRGDSFTPLQPRETAKFGHFLQRKRTAECAVLPRRASEMRRADYAARFPAMPAGVPL